jgi:hypothetical protein
MLLLRDGTFFVPRLEASSAMSQRLAHAYYGMPKTLANATFGERGGRLTARVGESSLEGSRVGGRAPLTAMARAMLRRRENWSACFPSGGSVKARLPCVWRAVCIRVLEARIASHPPWLPAPAEPFGIGLLLEDLRMRLQPPEAMEAAANQLTPVARPARGPRPDARAGA